MTSIDPLPIILCMASHISELMSSSPLPQPSPCATPVTSGRITVSPGEIGGLVVGIVVLVVTGAVLGRLRLVES